MNDKQGDMTNKPAMAYELDRMASAWQEQGELGKALSCYRKALRLWRELAVGAPEHYRSKLYDSLLALGYFRIIMGEPEEGIGHWEEMLAINRGLVDKGELTVATLAYNLTMYGFMLERVRRVKDSLTAHLEALDHYRRLARDDDSYLSALSKCLNTVGSRYADMGRVYEGVRFVQEAITCVSVQPELNPEERVSCLSEFLFNLAGLYRRLGEGIKATALCAEAVERSRALAANGTIGSMQLLAGNLERLAVFLIREDRSGEAVKPIDESVSLFRRLAEMTPGEYAQRLAGALLTQGELFVRMERVEGALESFREAAKVYGGLADKDAYAYTGKYLTSLCRQGYAASKVGRRDEVNESYARALQLENRFIRRYGLTFAPFVEDSFERLL